jgi:hypothetical protein
VQGSLKNGIDGGGFYGMFSLSNALVYKFSEDFSISYGNMIGTLQGNLNAKLYSKDYKTSINQDVFMNGINLNKNMGDWGLRLHAINTQFLKEENSMMDNFQTYGTVISFYHSVTFLTSLSYDYMYSEEYQAYRLGLTGSFQF